MSVVIGYRDYWNTGTILAKSSQYPTYPVEDTQVDILDQTWQSQHGTGSGNGLFTIAATYKYIDFDEGGAEETATLTTGFYTGTSLAAEVQTQLIAAGLASGTCTYDETTGLFTITAPSGTFNIRWQNGTHTATSAAPVLGYSQAANDTGGLTYSSDYARFHYPLEYIAIDLGSAVALDMFFIGNHNFSSAALTYLQGADDDAFTTNVVTETLTWTATSIYGFFSEVRTKRYWRLLVFDPTNPDGYIEVGVIKLYLAWTLSRGIDASYAPGKESASEIGTRDRKSVV